MMNGVRECLARRHLAAVEGRPGDAVDEEALTSSASQTKLELETTTFDWQLLSPFSPIWPSSATSGSFWMLRQGRGANIVTSIVLK